MNPPDDNLAIFLIGVTVLVLVAVYHFATKKHLRPPDRTSKKAKNSEGAGHQVASTKRITHLLVLHQRIPSKNEGEFIQDMLQCMSVDGFPKANFLDSQTKIHFMVVGPQDFNEEYISHMALVQFRSLWNITPVLNEIQYSRFSGPEGKGTTIEKWHTDKS